MPRIITPASNKNRTLAFIGDSNWDLYLDSNSMLWSVPKDDKSGAKETFFGDRSHVLNLKRKGYFRGYRATAAGRMLMDNTDSLFMSQFGSRIRVDALR